MSVPVHRGELREPLRAGRPPIGTPRRTGPVILDLWQFLALVALTFVIGWCVGQMTAPNAVEMNAPKRTLANEVSHAYAQAAWCGGIVQVEPVYDGTKGSIRNHSYDVVVTGCDQ